MAKKTAGAKRTGIPSFLRNITPGAKKAERLKQKSPEADRRINGAKNSSAKKSERRK